MQLLQPKLSFLDNVTCIVSPNKSDASDFFIFPKIINFTIKILFSD